ncbi:class I SAM-dependent methyltransferase [Photobacterium leiognathi]|uniref:class I SAM-dependent methyltransferase n=1 Tax=Photobacterium leiognathi TaxID=553611 RepID=UPI002982795F|nr:class I SAM-dependent methyltransferase [Photobacterium leiognathi]
MTKVDRYVIPSDLLQPLWYRSRESLADDGLIYDPVAAAACRQCYLVPDCVNQDVPQRQLLHATLTLQCDHQVRDFLTRHPQGLIVNVGAGLDTRFYRLDNGRCRWFELDTDENLLWREKLFHRSDRYTLKTGSVLELDWLKRLPKMTHTSMMLLCDQALLSCDSQQLATFLQKIGCSFSNIEICVVVAGDLCHSPLAKKMGCSEYQHGYRDPAQQVLNWLPWAELVHCYSPLDRACPRWRTWQRWIAKMPSMKYRLTPVLVHLKL